MAYTYQRTVTVTPASDQYAWSAVDGNGNDILGGWIQITEDSNIEDQWDILVQDNTGSSQRTATLTVTHSNGTTSDSISVTQAGVASSSNPQPNPQTGYTMVTGAATNIFDSGFTMHGDPDYTAPAGQTGNPPGSCPRGFMWGTDSNNLTNEIIDTTSSNNNPDPNTFMGGTNAFSYNLTGLQPETTYYYKAFITENSQICEPAGGGIGSGNPGTKLFGALQTVTTAAATLNFTAFNTSVGTSLSNSVAGNEVDETPQFQRIWFEIQSTNDLAGYTIDIDSLVKTSPTSGAGEILDFSISNSSMIPNGSTNLTSLTPFEFGANGSASNSVAVLSLAIQPDNVTEGDEVYQLTISPDYKDANGNVAGQHGLSLTKTFTIRDTSGFVPVQAAYGDTTEYDMLGTGVETTANGVTILTYTFDNDPATVGPAHQILLSPQGDPLHVFYGTGNVNTPGAVYWSNSPTGASNDSNAIQHVVNGVISGTLIDQADANNSGSGGQFYGTWQINFSDNALPILNENENVIGG